MNATVYNRAFRHVYETPLRSNLCAKVPRDAVFLSASSAVNQGIVLFWEVTSKVPLQPEEASEERMVKAYAVNQELPSGAVYLATVRSFGSAWHIYELPQVPRHPTTNKVEGPSRTKHHV